MYVSFIDLEETYNRVNREALWQFLRMCDVDGKLLSGIKSMYVTSLACVRMKGGKSECFRIERDKSECFRIEIASSACIWME